MANTVFENKVISQKATDLLNTAIDAKNLMTIDNNLVSEAGMIRHINTYTYSGTVNAVNVGEGTADGSLTYVGKDYTVQMLQQSFAYADEDVMKDDNIVDMGIKGATEIMANHLTNQYYAALETKVSGNFLVGTTNVTTKISYDGIVDAIADMNIEKESELFLLITPAMKADIRKDADYKSAQLGEVVYNGQIGTIAGIPVIVTKGITTANTAYIATKAAVTMFVKKNLEIEQDRVSNTRTNKIYLREAYICALTDATKARRIAITAA